MPIEEQLKGDTPHDYSIACSTGLQNVNFDLFILTVWVLREMKAPVRLTHSDYIITGRPAYHSALIFGNTVCIMKNNQCDIKLSTTTHLATNNYSKTIFIDYDSSPHADAILLFCAKIILTLDFEPC